MPGVGAAHFHIYYTCTQKEWHVLLHHVWDTFPQTEMFQIHKRLQILKNTEQLGTVYQPISSKVSQKEVLFVQVLCAGESGSKPTYSSNIHSVVL